MKKLSLFFYMAILTGCTVTAEGDGDESENNDSSTPSVNVSTTSSSTSSGGGAFGSATQEKPGTVQVDLTGLSGLALVYSTPTSNDGSSSSNDGVNTQTIVGIDANGGFVNLAWPALPDEYVANSESLPYFSSLIPLGPHGFFVQVHEQGSSYTSYLGESGLGILKLDGTMEPIRPPASIVSDFRQYAEGGIDSVVSGNTLIFRADAANHLLAYDLVAKSWKKLHDFYSINSLSVVAENKLWISGTPGTEWSTDSFAHLYEYDLATEEITNLTSGLSSGKSLSFMEVIGEGTILTSNYIYKRNADASYSAISTEYSGDSLTEKDREGARYTGIGENDSYYLNGEYVVPKDSAGFAENSFATQASLTPRTLDSANGLYYDNGAIVKVSVDDSEALQFSLAGVISEPVNLTYNLSRVFGPDHGFTDYYLGLYNQYVNQTYKYYIVTINKSTLVPDFSTMKELPSVTGFESYNGGFFQPTTGQLFIDGGSDYMVLDLTSDTLELHKTATSYPRSYPTLFPYNNGFYAYTYNDEMYAYNSSDYTLSVVTSDVTYVPASGDDSDCEIDAGSVIFRGSSITPLLSVVLDCDNEYKRGFSVFSGTLTSTGTPFVTTGYVRSYIAADSRVFVAADSNASFAVVNEALNAVGTAVARTSLPRAVGATDLTGFLPTSITGYGSDSYASFTTASYPLAGNTVGAFVAINNTTTSQNKVYYTTISGTASEISALNDIEIQGYGRLGQHSFFGYQDSSGISKNLIIDENGTVVEERVSPYYIMRIVPLP